MSVFKLLGIPTLLACLTAVSGTAKAQSQFAVDDTPTMALSEASYASLVDRLDLSTRFLRIFSPQTFPAFCDPYH